MAFISDLLMAAAAFGAAVYCFVLSRRLKALTRLDSGMGGAIALLSAQVDDLSQTLVRARDTAGSRSENLEAMVARAEAVSKRLELLLATMHDLPDHGMSPQAPVAQQRGTGRTQPAETNPAFAESLAGGGASPPRAKAQARAEAAGGGGGTTPGRARIVRRRQTAGPA